MKKKVLFLILMIFGITLITGCGTKENEAALKFKEEYESLNGTANKSGKEHRTVSISKDNPYEKVTPEKIIELIDNKESFYLYVGDSLCPWCRSVIEKSIEVAKENDIEKIYYIDIWDDEGNEILRDKYEIDDNNKLNKVVEGTDAYSRLLKEFDSVLGDYKLTDKKGKEIDTGEKRIYAPNFFYISKGEVTMMVEGTSDKQKDAREELTKEILEDEETEFNKLFKSVCDTAC